MKAGLMRQILSKVLSQNLAIIYLFNDIKRAFVKRKWLKFKS